MLAALITLWLVVGGAYLALGLRKVRLPKSRPVRLALVAALAYTTVFAFDKPVADKNHRVRVETEPVVVDGSTNYVVRSVGIVLTQPAHLIQQ